jgi:hypothetical protein
LHWGEGHADLVWHQNGGGFHLLEFGKGIEEGPGEEISRA